MGDFITLTTSDGFSLDAYRATPASTPKGGIVVIQEIFGVNQHIREVADGYAEKGYVALAPAIFDRVEKAVELGYDEDGMTRGIEIARGKLDMEETIRDLEAAIANLASHGKVGAVGYCFGGMLAYLLSCRVDSLSCAVGYYGGGIAAMLDLKPQIPLMLHFGELDTHIPMSDVNAIKAAHPSVPVHTYNADHGFNCDHRASYDKPAAQLALSRTLAFFDEHL